MTLGLTGATARPGSVDELPPLVRKRAVTSERDLFRGHLVQLDTRPCACGVLVSLRLASWVGDYEAHVRGREHRAWQARAEEAG